MAFRSIAKLTEDPVEVFWLAGFVLNNRNEWKVRVVYRNKCTRGAIPVLEPIGMLPILSLGTWFDHGVLQTDDLPGDIMEAVIPDVGRPTVITSAEIAGTLYPLPVDRAGRQRLFRYQTEQGTVHIPAVELIRALFVHNRALALALMRPAGLEQLYAPMAPGRQESATLKFTKEMAKSTLSRELVMEFAWLVLDPAARRAWESVRRLSDGQDCILFEPPPIRNSAWQFRGLKHGNQVLVLELLHVGGRSVPATALEYMHPGLKKAIRTGETGGRTGGSKGESNPGAKEREDEIDVADGDEGSGSYRSPHVTDVVRRLSSFENKVKVVKSEVPVQQKIQNASGSKGQKKPRQRHAILVTTGERAAGAKLKPMEFRILRQVPQARMGDLEAFDETVRHMRDKLPDVELTMGLVQLKQGKAAASVGSVPRAAMVVRISSPRRSPIVLIDIDRTGIVALSLMALHFREGLAEDQIEGAVQTTIDGWVNAGGHWSSEFEAKLEKVCRCERIPKAMIPRGGFEKLAEMWALRLMDKLGL